MAEKSKISLAEGGFSIVMMAVILGAFLHPGLIPDWIILVAWVYIGLLPIFFIIVLRILVAAAAMAERRF